MTMKSPDCFARVVTHKYFMDLIKEARRVKYEVLKDSGVYEVKDDETGEMVLWGIKHSKNAWLTRFNKKYWQEPEIV